MSLKITTLVENTIGENLALRNEHGISFFIEKDNIKCLFDTGKSDAFLYNSSWLNIDLMKTDYVVLSHGHYDHSGGLRYLVEKTTDFSLFTGKGFFDEKYAFRNNSYEYLGNNFDERFIVENNISHAVLDKQITEISSGIFLITSFNRTHSDEVVNSRFRLKRGDEFIPDRFEDEVMIAVDTPEGLVLILGCSHPGVKNMIDTARELLKKPVYAVIGGTHLVEAGSDSLEKSINYFLKGDIAIIGVSHCTGEKAKSGLSAAGKRYFHNRTGSSLFIK